MDRIAAAAASGRGDDPSPLVRSGATLGTEPVEISSAGDWFVLLKPRVVALVVFTGLVGLLVAPGHLHPVLAFTAVLCIAVAAGAAGAINMWYDRDIDALMRRTAAAPDPGRPDRAGRGARLRRHPRRRLGAADGARHQHACGRDPGALDRLLRLRLHDLAEAADAAEHRHRRRGRRVSAADRLGRGDRRRRIAAGADVR